MVPENKYLCTSGSSDEILMFFSKNIYFLYISIVIFVNGKHCDIECAS